MSLVDFIAAVAALLPANLGCCDERHSLINSRNDKTKSPFAN
jgi:hypothetical protein